jgi:L-rhamnose 1-dehydrogenase
MLTATPGVADAADGMRQRTPQRRLGQPSEIGDVVAWLGSDLSTYISGASTVVDGGLTAVL